MITEAITIPPKYKDLLDYFVEEYALVVLVHSLNGDNIFLEFKKFLEKIHQIHYEQKADYFWFKKGELKWSLPTNTEVPSNAIFIDKQKLRELKLNQLIK
jgi:hypothetical protein